MPVGPGRALPWPEDRGSQSAKADFVSLLQRIYSPLRRAHDVPAADGTVPDQLWNGHNPLRCTTRTCAGGYLRAAQIHTGNERDVPEQDRRPRAEQAVEA